MEWVGFEVDGELDAMARYRLLKSARSSARQRGVRVLGFRLDRDASWLLDGSRPAIDGLMRGLKTGTVQAQRHRGRSVYLGQTWRRAVYDPEAVLAVLHRGRAGVSPLADPWTSHRDLLGFRRAGFVDPAMGLGATKVHLDAGGGPIPRVVAVPQDRPVRDVPQTELSMMLRVTSGVLGVLPGNREAFGLYACLGRCLGARQADLADALMLTSRRIRQLVRGSDALLPVALAVWSDDRLRRVP